MFDAVFTRAARVTEYRGTIDVDRQASGVFNAGLRSHGIFKSDSKMYVSLAHDERDVRDTLTAFAAAARAV